MGTMQLDEMRKALSTALGRDPYEDIWQDMADWTEWVIEDSPTPLEDVLAEYRKKESIYYGGGQRVRGPQGPRSPREVPPDNRSRALAELLAIRASRIPEVQRFRQEQLGGHLITFDELPIWVEEQAKKDGKATTWLTVPLPDRAEPLTPEDLTSVLLVTAQAFRQDKSQSVGLSMSTEVVNYPKPGDRYVHSIPIRVGGTLWNLKRTAGLLQERFTWREASAVGFLLTGLVPPMPKATLNTKRVGESAALNRITLTVDPRLSPKEVAELYAPIRARIFQSRDRPLSDKHLRLAIFTEEHAPDLSWKEMLSKWNQEQPDWSYEDRLNNFARDGQSAWERLTEQPWPGKERLGHRPGIAQLEDDMKRLMERLGGSRNGQA